KALKTRKSLKEKIMVLCYEMAGLRNKQVSGVKAALGLFFTKSGASAHYDYYNLHSTCIPSTNSAKQIVHMATILFNTIKCPPISYNSTYANSYNSEKSNLSWVSNKTNLIENLTIHSYNANIAQKYHRKFNQTKLIDCIELDLKNAKDYVEAVKTFLSLPEVIEYLRNYIIPLLADFPGQLFIQRAIVKKLESEELPIPKEIIHL
ncbi:5887_t:CDS:2, partial [Dentiscutata erythropus]